MRDTQVIWPAMLAQIVEGYEARDALPDFIRNEWMDAQLCQAEAYAPGFAKWFMGEAQ